MRDNRFFQCEPDESCGRRDELADARAGVAHVRVVFEMESDTMPNLLGTFAGVDEDYVRYTDGEGRRLWAPADCVQIVDVQVPLHVRAGWHDVLPPERPGRFV